MQSLSLLLPVGMCEVGGKRAAEGTGSRVRQSCPSSASSQQWNLGARFWLTLDPLVSELGFESTL